ncbi:MAG: energy transducer TonB [Methylococcus sp.]|nr:MAG: energy transducer TonB [Methylococcus sp.]
MPSRSRFFIALLVALALHALILSGVYFMREAPPPRRQAMTLELIATPAPPARQRAEALAPKGPPAPPKPKAPNKGVSIKVPRPSSGQPPSPSASLEPPSEIKRPVLSRGLLSQQIAEVTAGITRDKTRDFNQKKIVYTSAVRAHQPVVAAYEAAWHEKVERVGNLNFPEAARKEKLSGVLVMAVGIRPDGSLYSAQVQTSSGHEVLDQAAREIVRMAAPFAPLPPDILSEVDILVITRTWRFDGQDHLETRGAE